MKKGATTKFVQNISDKDRYNFAELSGDWNPLHTSEEYAKKTEYKSCILHGAFSAGLLSRMAGMLYPGESCLLHGMQLKFIRPIRTPITVSVIGDVVRDNGALGEVRCRIENITSGDLLVEGFYQFERRECHKKDDIHDSIIIESNRKHGEYINKTIVTGSTGSMGAALIERLGKNSIPLRSRDLIELNNEEILERINHVRISNIVHCGWPTPN